MRSVIAVAVVAFLGVWNAAEAQESFCIAANANQVTRVNDAISRQNALVCTRYNLAIPCTQAQVCVPAGCTGGAACTPNQARQCNARIYDNTSQPGREEFVNELTKTGFLNMENSIRAFDNTTFCDKFKVSTRAQKDQSCTAVGFVAGCEVCQ